MDNPRIILDNPRVMVRPPGTPAHALLRADFLVVSGLDAGAEKRHPVPERNGPCFAQGATQGRRQSFILHSSFCILHFLDRRGGLWLPSTVWDGD